MPKVLIADKLSPAAVAIFKERGIEADVKTGLSKEELLKIVDQYDGMAIRSATKVTADVIKAAKKLKVVGRAGIGVDNVDIPAATAAGVIVMNTPFGNSITTAEHAIAMMMALARDLPAANASTQAGKWEKNRFMGTEVYGKTLGLIGAGNIGSIVADRAKGLKMHVVAFDPYLSPERASSLGIEKVELNELLARADFITLHTPLTDSTRNMIDAAAIAKMKRGVRIINGARGGLIVEADLKAALDAGQVAGAALDVFIEEPPKESSLFGRETLVATPHLGAATTEAQENVAIQVAEQMADFLVTGAVVNALNMPSLTAEEAVRLRPYMALAQQLGSFAGQLTESFPREIAVEYEGHAAELEVKPLTATVLTAILAPQLDTVNMVNAPVICRERDIRVSETRRSEPTDYHTKVRVSVATEQGRRTVAGTLFGGSKPRVIEVEGITMEAELGPNMLLIRNNDKPGFIGNLGRTLGAAGINIATLNLGRDGPGGNALVLAQVDQPLDDAVLAEVCAIPNVVQTRALRFNAG
jgi:D-3-phosphoglycerate dehydrogenase